MKRTDMLSARNVRIHGMQSSRWTTKDKITQFKGLINLYKRDKKIADVDLNVARRKQIKELKKIRNDIENGRRDLENETWGDKQQLRNTLGEHREMQLAYQNTFPPKVIENIHQINFAKRKELDRLTYAMQQVSKRLIDLKLEKSVLEDRLTFECGKKLPIEIQAEIITGKVQDAILKREAALAIRHTYSQMLDVMSKDALYFDAILKTIQEDSAMQGKCLINATELGQLATEYLDDRRLEYKTLEGVVKKDMHARKRDLDQAQEQLETAQNTIKSLLRRDSDVNLCTIKFEDTESLLGLKSDLEKITGDLKVLKEWTMVPTFEAIYPCLQQQINNSNRLREFVKKTEKERDILLKKTQHAELMCNILKTTRVESTAEYKIRKKELLEKINGQIETKRATDELMTSRCNLMAKVRIALLQARRLTKPIAKPGEEARGRARIADRYSDDDVPEAPEIEPADGCVVAVELLPKLKLLNGRWKAQAEGLSIAEAYKFYENLMKDQCRNVADFQISEVVDDSLLEGMELEISHVLTRDDIKKQSDEIVEANTKSDDLVPVVQLKKKKKKFK